MKTNLLLPILFFYLSLNVAFAQVPKTLSYQGLLTDSSGNNVPDGEYSILFRLYGQENGGAHVWEESQNVSVSKGIFSAILGNSTALEVPFTKAYWLGLKVNEENEMSPRIALTASPYSLSGSETSMYWAKTDNSINYNGGNVGIGTETPLEKLDINEGSVTITKSGNSANLVDRPFIFLNQKGDSDYGGGLIWQDNGENKLELFHFKSTNEIIFYNSQRGFIGAMRDSGSFWINDMIEPSGIKFRDGSQLTSALGLAGGVWGNNSGNIFFNTGSVGIGTDSPRAKLSVLGKTFIQGNASMDWGNSFEPNIDLALDDNDTGLEVPSDGNLAFITNAEERARIDHLGRFGLGTDTPIQELDIRGRINVEEGVIQRGGETITETSDLGLYSGILGNYMRFVTTDAPFHFYTDGGMGITPVVSITNNGNVGIGNPAPEWPLEVNDASGVGTWVTISNMSPGGREWGLISSGESNDESAGKLLIRDNTSNQVRMTIDTEGQVGIGTYNPTHPLEMASGAHVTAGGVWTNASSRSLKENIKALSSKDAFSALLALNPVTYNYLSEKNENYVGFIAEDVPDVVAMNDRKSLSSMDLVALLTKVVQEQQKSIEMLTREIEKLNQK